MASIETALHQAAEKLENLRSKSVADDHDDVFQGIRFHSYHFRKIFEFFNLKLLSD